MNYKVDNYYVYISFDRFDWNNNLAQECIESIKKNIPLDEREYNPDTKKWTVHKKHNDLILEFYNRDKDPNQLDLFNEEE